MNRIERTVRRIDAFQQRHRVTSFAFGLVQKYGNDNGGALAARLTFAALTTVFPLLLLLVTLLAIVLADHPGLEATVLHSAYGEIPVVGRDLATNVHAMRRNSAFGLAVGLVGLAYGVRGLAGVGLQIMEEVWYLPKAIRPSFITRLGRSFAFVAVLGIGLVVTTFLSGVGTFGGHGLPYRAGAEALAAVANVGIYLFAFRILTPKQVDTRCLLPGVVAAGILWTALQALGTYVVNHYLRDDNAVYGTFGTVLGLVAWFNMAAQLTVYCAELNPYLVHRLWPRGMVQPPLTKADQELAALQATTNRFRPEVEMEVRVRGRPMSQAEYLANGQVGAGEIGTVKRVPSDKTAPAGSVAGSEAASPPTDRREPC
jgi:YihY family inner membrane protein